MPVKFTTSYLEDVVGLFTQLRRLAERAIEQATEKDLLTALDSEGNSIAIIVKHMAGNMRSRWTDFLTSDGEKPDRNRDSEFENGCSSREELLRCWNEGWAHVFRALEALSEGDLTRTVTIRGEAHSVMQAINRQLAHYSQHVGQIILLAKHFSGREWKTLSIPKRASTDDSSGSGDSVLPSHR